jgi:hypothetical protein
MIEQTMYHRLPGGLRHIPPTFHHAIWCVRQCFASYHTPSGQAAFFALKAGKRKKDKEKARVVSYKAVQSAKIKGLNTLQTVFWITGLPLL